MKNVTFIFIFITWSAVVSAQNYLDLARFDYAITPPTEFDSSATTTMLHEMNGNLTIPIVINEKAAFLTGLTYEQVSASFHPGRARESFTALTLRLGINLQHNSRWSGSYMLLPQLSSDWKEISRRDLQLGLATLLTYSRNAHFNYKFGVYANTDLFGPFIVPILGFNYLNSTEKLEIKTLLPLSADINYLMAQHFSLGLSFKGQIKSFNVNTPVGLETNRYLTKSAKDLYTYLQYALTNGLHFQLAIGRSIGRSYRMYDDQVLIGFPLLYLRDNRTQLNNDFSDSWLFKTTVFYRLALAKKA